MKPPEWGGAKPEPLDPKKHTPAAIAAAGARAAEAVTMAACPTRDETNNRFCCLACASAALRFLDCPCNGPDCEGGRSVPTLMAAAAAAVAAGKPVAGPICSGGAVPLFSCVPPRPDAWHNCSHHKDYASEFVLAASTSAITRGVGATPPAAEGGSGGGGASVSASTASASASSPDSAAAAAVPPVIAPLDARVWFAEGDALRDLLYGRGLEAISHARVVYGNNFSNKWETDGFQARLYRLLSRVMMRGAVLVSSTRFTSGTRRSQGFQLCDQISRKEGTGEVYSKTTLYFEVCGGWQGPGGLAEVQADPSLLTGVRYDNACELVWRADDLSQTWALRYVLASRRYAKAVGSTVAIRPEGATGRGRGGGAAGAKGGKR